MNPKHQRFGPDVYGLWTVYREKAAQLSLSGVQLLAACVLENVSSWIRLQRPAAVCRHIVLPKEHAVFHRPARKKKRFKGIFLIELFSL